MKRKRATLKLNGYLTVFLSLSLAMLLGVFFLLIQAAFSNFSKMQLECAADIGMNSALGEFNRELLQQYDLLFIDMSYGSANAALGKVENHMAGYVIENIRAQAGSVSAWNELKLNDLYISQTLAPHHYDGKILKRQAAAYIGENAQANAISDIGALLTQGEKYDDDDGMAAWQGVMGTITTLLASLTEEKRQEAIAADPDADVDSINVTIDNPADTAFEDAKEYMDNLSDGADGGGSVTLADYYSRRTAAYPGPAASEYDEGLLGKLANDHLFRCYMFEKMGRHLNLKEGSRLNYQVEYVIAGKNNDNANLRSIKLRIFSWRFANNIFLYQNSKAKQTEARGIALTVTSLILQPQLTEAVAQSILFMWAFNDSKKDLDEIMDGGKIPLVKESIGSTKGAIGYEKYLEIMLGMQMLYKEKTVIARVMDIMEMDIRKTPGNQHFRMDWCIESFRARLEFSDRYEQYAIERTYGYY